VANVRSDKDLTPAQWEIRNAAEADLETFIRLISPKQVLGSVHSELCSWWTRSEASSHQVTLLPRDHGKSRMVAYRVVWHITKHPDCRILYISATANLAEKQIKFIQDLMTSKLYSKYWPEMVNEKVGEREKWTASEFSVDHPKRKEEGVRDPTVFTAGLTTAITGLHADVIVQDDIVVYENAYTKEGREKVKLQYSLLASIAGADAREWVVGTRYHPDDLYGHMAAMEYDIYNNKGEVIGSKPVYEFFERQVEDAGDGTGEFIWPRQQRSDGKWFGFDASILSKKRAQYLDQTQFRAQYYNDPNGATGTAISRDKFQYYDKSRLIWNGSYWTISGRRLNIIAAMDLSYSITKKADSSVVIVLGIDAERNMYVLDIDRFKTDSIRDYYVRLLDMHTRWNFNKIVIETVAAQQAIVKELRESYLKPNGIMLSIIETKPNRHGGSKEERMMAVLEPVYSNMAVWHYRGGNCQILEDELVALFPPHDDIKDALSNAIEHIAAPTSNKSREDVAKRSNVIYHPKFGGVIRT